MLQIRRHKAGLYTPELGAFVSPEKGSVNGPSIVFNSLHKLFAWAVMKPYRGQAS